jgi:hypothetical protein
MDLNPGTARYSTDELAPVTPISRSERESRPASRQLFDRPGEVGPNDEEVMDLGQAEKGLNPLACQPVLPFSPPCLPWLDGSCTGGRCPADAWLGRLTVWFLNVSTELRHRGSSLAADRRWYPVPVKPVVFQDDPLSTPDHKTAESANATYEYWVSFMPGRRPPSMVAHVDAAWFGD